ncbi:MAG: hypothetical protein ABFS35_19170 [Bacteroidota bacterium]
MMINKISAYLWVFAAFSMVFLYACKDAYKFDMDKMSAEAKIESNWALPLIDANMTLEELLPDDDSLDRYLIIDEDKFITLIFDKDFATYDVDTFMQDEPLFGDVLDYNSYRVEPQIIELGLNELLDEGNIHFANPSFKIIIKNYWDIPAQYKVLDFYYYEEENSVALPIDAPLLTNWNEISRPANPGEFALEEIALETATSNVDEVLSALPHSISIGMDVETITDPPVSYDLRGVAPNEVSIEIRLPLELSMSNIKMTDTIDLDLGDNLDMVDVKSLKMELTTKNGFPLEVNSQIYFADSVYVIIDSLFNTPLNIDPAQVASGEVTSTSLTEKTIDLDTNQIDNIFKAKYLIPKLLFNTTNAENNEDVKFYTTYGIELKLGALIELNADIE